MKRKTLTKVLALSLSAVMVLGNIAPAYAAKTTEISESKENIASGISNQVTWAIDSEGHLTVSGRGDMVGIPWEAYRDEIITAKIDVKGMTDAIDLFAGCRNMISVDLSDFDTSEITSMWNMFRECESLTSLDLSGFDTSNVYDMDALFAGCRSLTSLDLSSFDTSNVCNMNATFEHCSALKELDLSKFNMMSAEHVGNMLFGCYNLEKIYTPCNSVVEIELPVRSKFYHWETENGTIHKSLPTGMSESMMLVKNYTGVSAEAPSLTLVKEDGIVTGIELVNNEETDCTIWFGLATQTEIDTYVEVYDGIWLEPFELTELSMKEVIRNGGESGNTYYIVAFAEGEEKDRSEVVVLENYPITVTESMMEEPIVYQTGSISGNLYFGEKSVDEYLNARVSVFLRDLWENEWSDTFFIYNNDKLFYLDINERYMDIEEWIVESVEFSKINVTEHGCVLEKEIYTSIAEDGLYEEPRVEAPSIELVEAEGEEPFVVIQNIDEEECDINYGLLTQSEIENGEDVFHGTWLESLDSTWETISYLIEEDIHEPGEYYLVAYAYNEDSFRSEMAVLENFSINAIYHEMEEALKYQVGEISENLYFTETSAEDYDYVQAQVYVEDSWTEITSLDIRKDIWYFNAEDYNDWYEGWILEQVKFGKIDYSDDGYTVEITAYTDVEESGIYAEPKAAAPEITLSKTLAGKVNGVYIKNNDDDYNDVVVGLLTKEEFEAGEEISYSSSIEGLATVWMPIENFIKTRNFESGEYYIVAYAWNENEFKSDMVILEEYPITFETKVYEGEDIVITQEASEDATWYYVDADQLPENTSIVHINGYEFQKSNDGTCWKRKIWSPMSSVEEMIFCETISDDTGMTVLSKIVPEEKVYLEGQGEEKDVLILDYDYYNAFIASGGSVTIDENGVLDISNDNFSSEDKWTLEYFYNCFKNSELGSLIKDIAYRVKFMANLYWGYNGEKFEAVNYYDMAGNMIGDDMVSEHDVILIEYAPKIVWVDSIELTAPETMKPNEKETVVAKLDAGQDKYPFNRTPQVRFESSNPEIVSVDSETGELIAGTVAGTATITAYADEDLRNAVNNDDIVSASVEIKVVKEVVGKDPVTEDFEDISVGDWYVSAVQYVYDNGIMSGNNGLFNPTGNITRAQVVTTLYNLAGRPAVTDYSAVEEMIDVQAGQWYTDAVCWAYSVGVANGNATTKMFNMSNPVTRQQLATFFYNYAEFKGLDTETRTDISGMLGADQVASYALDTMQWAVGTGLITGSATNVNGVTVYDLKPTGTATRAQMASILQRFCEKNHL